MQKRFHIYDLRVMSPWAHNLSRLRPPPVADEGSNFGVPKNVLHFWGKGEASGQPYGFSRTGETEGKTLCLDARLPQHDDWQANDGLRRQSRCCNGALVQVLASCQPKNPHSRMGMRIFLVLGPHKFYNLWGVISCNNDTAGWRFDHGCRGRPVRRWSWRCRW